MRGFCPGGVCPGEFCLGGFGSGGFGPRGILSVFSLSVFFCLGGILSGGFCPVTQRNIMKNLIFAYAPLYLGEVKSCFTIYHIIW